MSDTVRKRVLALDRVTLLGWIQRCDPNGCWTDAAGRAEGFRPIRKRELVDMLTDGDHDDMIEWIGEQLTVQRREVC